MQATKKAWEANAKGDGTSPAVSSVLDMGEQSYAGWMLKVRSSHSALTPTYTHTESRSYNLRLCVRGSLVCIIQHIKSDILSSVQTPLRTIKRLVDLCWA